MYGIERLTTTSGTVFYLISNISMSVQGIELYHVGMVGFHRSGVSKVGEKRIVCNGYLFVSRYHSASKGWMSAGVVYQSCY
jgi:hypothetical protein